MCRREHSVPRSGLPDLTLTSSGSFKRNGPNESKLAINLTDACTSKHETEATKLWLLPVVHSIRKNLPR